MTAHTSYIPILDFGAVRLSVKEEELTDENNKQFGEQMKDALASAVFCYLKNHAIDKELIEGFMHASPMIFAHPEGVKRNHLHGKEEIPDNSALKPGQIRLGEHSDYGTITLLFQEDVGALEADIPGKEFVLVTPIPDIVVVNIDDLMQRWTSGALIATKHRVLIPEVEFKKRKSSQSVVCFVHPDDVYIIKPLDGSDKYEPITNKEYLQERLKCYVLSDT